MLVCQRGKTSPRKKRDTKSFDTQGKYGKRELWVIFRSPFESSHKQSRCLSRFAVVVLTFANIGGELSISPALQAFISYHFSLKPKFRAFAWHYRVVYWTSHTSSSGTDTRGGIAKLISGQFGKFWLVDVIRGLWAAKKVWISFKACISSLVLTNTLSYFLPFYSTKLTSFAISRLWNPVSSTQVMPPIYNAIPRKTWNFLVGPPWKGLAWAVMFANVIP